MDKNIIDRKIIEKDFKAAYDIIKNYSFQERHDIINKLAYINSDLVYYDFIKYIISQENSAEAHFLASIVMGTSLCHFENSYEISLEHTRAALEIDDSNIEYMEWLLFLNNIPEKLVSNQEGKVIALKILKYDKENKVGKQFLAENFPDDVKGF